MEKAYKLEFSEDEFNDLYVYCCGCSQTLPHHSFGPAIKPHFMIHYIINGKGTFSFDGKSYPLREGNGFLIIPEELAYYEADGDEPWTYVWVGFGGKRAAEIVSQLGLSMEHPIFRSDKADTLYDIVKDMMDHNTFSTEDVLRRNGLLSLFLSEIASTTIITEHKASSSKGNNYVQKAQAFIRQNYCNPIKITDVASYVCVNRS